MTAHLAGAGGFEPPHGGIKIRCLTAWLRPIAALRASDTDPDARGLARTLMTLFPLRKNP
jgi:hypothetical protein